jgi:hypothetical protein
MPIVLGGLVLSRTCYNMTLYLGADRNLGSTLDLRHRLLC